MTCLCQKDPSINKEKKNEIKNHEHKIVCLVYFVLVYCRCPADTVIIMSRPLSVYVLLAVRVTQCVSRHFNRCLNDQAKFA